MKAIAVIKNAFYVLYSLTIFNMGVFILSHNLFSLIQSIIYVTYALIGLTMFIYVKYPINIYDLIIKSFSRVEKLTLRRFVNETARSFVSGVVFSLLFCFIAVLCRHK